MQRQKSTKQEQLGWLPVSFTETVIEDLNADSTRDNCLRLTWTKVRLVARAITSFDVIDFTVDRMWLLHYVAKCLVNECLLLSLLFLERGYSFLE